MCGSYCTHDKALGVLRALEAVYEIVPIFSYNVMMTDTRFGTHTSLYEKVSAICSREPVSTITEAEKLGPSVPLDVMLICPCTGNTAAKLAAGITDTPVTMAAKAHLRNSRPLVIALATNDALSGNIVNIGKLMQRKNIYFTPMRQDDTVGKPYSLVADFSLCAEAVAAALDGNGRELRPLFE